MKEEEENEEEKMEGKPLSSLVSTFSLFLYDLEKRALPPVWEDF
jgi:hypothetical protein